MIFGNDTKFIRGKVHKYLLVDMECSHDGTMIVSIINYLQKIIDDFPEVIRSTYDTYSEEHLFTVQD